MALIRNSSVLVTLILVLLLVPLDDGVTAQTAEPPVGIVGGAGSWVFNADGRVFFLPPTELTFRRFEVFDLGAFGLAAPVIDASLSGEGAIGVATDGGVFALFGASYHGSIPGLGVSVVSPIDALGLISTVDGYWLAGQDGGVFAFGEASFYGSLPERKILPTSPIVDIVPTTTGQGYWLVAADGGVFAFGDAPYLGSLPELDIETTTVVGMIGHESGYRIIERFGRSTSFGDVPNILLDYDGPKPITDVDPTGLGGYWVTVPNGKQIGYGPRDCTGLSIRC